MSTPNVSFDSPIVVAKSNVTAGIESKEPSSQAATSVPESDSKETFNESKKVVKKDMFAPESDMFAEEYSVSQTYIHFIRFDHLITCEVYTSYG